MSRAPIDRLAVAAAGLLGALSTAGAALVAHGRLDGTLLMIAAAIGFVHAPALLALGLAGGTLRARAVPVLLLTGGVLLFSGDLAARTFFGERAFMNAAPTGGSLLILGWLSLAVLALLPARRP